MALATLLLQAFSPERHHGPAAGRWCEANQSLWASDAIHRANNLAQMAIGLSRIEPTRFGLDANSLIAADAEALAAMYAELGSAADPLVALPCGMMLERITTALVAMFGRGLPIDLRLGVDDIDLMPDRRRAMILIASELLINALKYAFAGRGSGVIHVSLGTRGEVCELVVEDDGIGLTGTEPSGSGSGLVAAMTGLLDGHFERGGRLGGGARLSIIFPLHATNS